MSSLAHKIENSQRLIAHELESAARPAVYFSSGKDSMVLLDLVLDVMTEMSATPDVIFHREPFCLEKYEFGLSHLAELGLTAYDYPPTAVAMWEGQEIMAWTNYYQVGLHPDKTPATLALPKNIIQPSDSNAGFVCGLDAIFRRPTGYFNFPWDLCFHGHKSSDRDQIAGEVPLKVDVLTPPAGPKVAFPLRDWTDEDVWEYTIRNGVPIDRDRYDVTFPSTKHTERSDKTHNSDYFNVCIRCCDRRQGETVKCPKTGLEINNISATIPYADIKLPYFGTT